MSDRLIPLRQVLAQTSLSRSTLYQRIKDGQFPPPVGLGGRRVAWRESAVTEWITARVKPTPGVRK